MSRDLIGQRHVHQPQGVRAVEPLCQRLKLSVADRKETQFLLEREAAVRAARSLPWPQLQRILIQEAAADLLQYGRAVAEVLDGHTTDVDYAAERLAQPPEQLNPPPLITGDDLRRLGIPAGPVYKTILDAVRDAQLEGRLQSPGEAGELARKLES